MKVLSKLIVLSAVLVIVNLAFATIVDDVLMVPMADEAPLIDGFIDDVWQATTAIPMLKFEDGSTITYDYMDKFTTFRIMWDEDALYILVETMDDSIMAPASLDPWNRDNVEVFMDEDNSKNDQATGYDANDHQWRYVVDDVYQAGVSTVPGPFAFEWTDSSYVFELSYTQADLPVLVLEPGSEFGFEISNADDDNEVNRSLVSHWWTSDAYGWNNPSVFGDAELTDEMVASAVLPVYYTEDDPLIDGVTDEDCWAEAPEYSMRKLEDGSTQPRTYKDKFASYKILWNENALYIEMTSYDDTVCAFASQDPWNRDCIEVFMDEDNSKNDQATGYDGNDHQWRWVVDEVFQAGVSTVPGPWAFEWNDSGFVWELSYTQADLPVLMLEDGSEFGFEISSADADNDQGRYRVAHWWTSDAYAWNNPSVFGEAELIGTTAIEAAAANMPTDYSLGNYPNPFNPTTTIEYSLATSSNVVLSVYDVLGNMVAQYNEGLQDANRVHTVQFDGSALTSGVYFYKLEAGSQVITSKMMLLK